MPRPRDERKSQELPAEPGEAERPDDGGARSEVVDALRALSEQVGELRDELEALRREQSALPAVAPEAHGWERPALVSSGPTWARSLDSPAARRPAVPRFALEVAFLVAVAVTAALARLDPLAIVAALAIAWVLVALVEWLAWSSARREDEQLAGLALGAQPVQSDLSWLAPPLEQAAQVEEEPVPAAKLPPAQPE